MARLLCSLALLVSLSVLASCQSPTWTGDYLTLGKPCDPAKDLCFPGSGCSAETKTCDCKDSQDGTYKRTWQNKECRLLPGSTCIPRVDQEYYRCVADSVCTVTRQGQDPRECPADGRCDPGDAECICQPGKTCLTKKVSWTAA